MNITEIAAKHNIASAELAARLTARGWDFSRLDQNNAAHVEFMINTIECYAQEIAAHHALKAKRAAEQAANRIACMTVAARKNPEAICGRCDGKGKVRGFEHVAEGVCFGCKGAGIIRRRAA